MTTRPNPGPQETPYENSKGLSVNHGNTATTSYSPRGPLVFKMNIFFEEFKTPFSAVPFGQWKIDDYLPSAKHAMQLARERIKKLKSSSENTFRGFLIPYLESSKELDLISLVFFNLHAANTNDEMEQVAQEFSPLLTQFSNELLLDIGLFQKIKTTYENRDSQDLTTEERTILEEQYKSFVRNGALLGDTEKQKLCEIDQQLAKLKVEFGKNALHSKNQFVLQVTEEELEGIPQEDWDIFLNAGKERKLSGYAVSFDHSVYLPFMKGAEGRDLREKIYTEHAQTATRGEFDNRRICLKIIRLRRQRAELLGYSHHAAFVLEQRMAQSSQEVMEFLTDLKNKAAPKAKDEIKKLAKFAKDRDQIDEIRPWDFSFYSEKYKKQCLDFDDKVLRPYFKLENVIQGLFDVATKLYGLSFRENTEIPKYHEDVRAYEVMEKRNSAVCGVFYGDFFPRRSKRQGAWMCYYQKQSEKQIPHVAIVCQFAKSTPQRPSLLTHGEVLTLFHEFGHALHGLLSKCQYNVLSGPQVYWDFVELPSQLMENWAFEKECLDLFARHYQTGELIPQSLVEKIKRSQTFLEGYATMRQLSLGFLDMILHTMNPDELTDVVKEEAKIMQEFDLFHYRHPRACMSTTFGHIFNGGYSAGYYSYKWAEILDADVFEVFRSKGIFNPQTAKSFKDNILSKGGTEHPMVLYERFRGQKPNSSALLRRSGLTP